MFFGPERQIIVQRYGIGGTKEYTPNEGAIKLRAIVSRQKSFVQKNLQNDCRKIHSEKV